MIRHSRGILYFNEKNYEKALKEFDEAITLKNDIAVYYMNRGKTYLE